MSVKPTKAIEVFFSYSHKDEELRDELEKHLSVLKRQGVIKGWHDRRIGAGREWKGEIDTHLNAAHVILLLISSDFLASDYCYDVEVERAMERHEAGEARVIPVILRPCDWKGAPFDKLQALPKDTKPVTEWLNRDKALLDVARGIRAAVKELAGPSVSPPSSVSPSSVSTTPVDLKGTATPLPVQESPLTKLLEAVKLGLQRGGCYVELGRILKIVIWFLVVPMTVILGWILFARWRDTDEAIKVNQLRVSVRANQYWYDTGIGVEQGDRLELKAEGKWWNGISTTGPKGDRGTLGLGRPECDLCPVVDGNLGELVGKVDDEIPFRIGNSIVEIATKDGNLFLAMNESTGSCEGGGQGSCYADNHGVLEVTVTVWRAKSSQIDVSPVQTQTIDNPNTTLLWRLAGHSDQVTSIAFSPDGNTLASGSRDKTVNLWDTQTGGLKWTLIGHDAPVILVGFSPDGGTVASGSGYMGGSHDTSVKLWDARTGDLKHTLTTVDNFYSVVTNITFSPDSRMLATRTYAALNHPSGYGYTSVGLWDAQREEMLTESCGTSAARLILSPDGKNFAISNGFGSPNAIQIWNVQTVELKWTLEGIRPIIFSPDGEYLAGRGDDKTIQIRDAQTGELKWTLESGGKVLSISFSPNGKYLASGGDDRTVRLWDTQTWNLLRQLAGHSGEVTSVAFSPDGSTFASWTSNEVVKLWDTETWEVRQTFEAYSEDVASIDLSPDWRTVIYWNSNDTVSLYDAQTGRAKGVLEEDSGAVHEIVFSPDGKTLASRGEGKTVSLWRIK